MTTEQEEEEDAPAGTPEYGDLLDADWLERTAEALEREDDLVDVGLTLDLDDRDDAEGLAYVVDLDVGTLLTSLPPAAPSREARSEPAEPAERELGDGTLALGALREVLLPEEELSQGQLPPRRRAEDDEEVGDDERFPVFEPSSVSLPSVPPADADEGEA